MFQTLQATMIKKEKKKVNLTATGVTGCHIHTWTVLNPIHYSPLQQQIPTAFQMFQIFAEELGNT